jgi:ssDNA-binding Zn-finger/Zn-ribbon topoisomerase 1
MQTAHDRMVVTSWMGRAMLHRVHVAARGDHRREGRRNRMTRLTQGADVTLSGVKLNGRSLEDFNIGEVAMIVGRFMFENAEDAGGGVRVCRMSLPMVVERLWPYQTMTKQTRVRVGHMLRANGFVAIGGGSQPFLGYRVPATMPTSLEDPPSETGNGKVVVREVAPAPVKTAWLCPECGMKLSTRFNRDRHMWGKHGTPKEETATMTTKTETPVAKKTTHTFTDRPCSVCGKMVRSIGLHMRKHRPSANDLRLYAAITDMPGEHPRDYAVLLDAEKHQVTQWGMHLRELGLIRSEGSHVSARYYPLPMPPTQPVAAETTPTTEAAKPVRMKSRRKTSAPAEVPTSTATPAGVPVAPDEFGQATAHAALEVTDSVRIQQAVLIDGKLLVVDGVVFAIQKRRVS